MKNRKFRLHTTHHTKVYRPRGPKLSKYLMSLAPAHVEAAYALLENNREA